MQTQEEIELLQKIKVDLLKGMTDQLAAERTINPEMVDIYIKLVNAGF